MNDTIEQFYQKRTVCITGGSKQLGAKMAIEFAKKGANLVLFDRSIEEMGSAIVSEIQAIGVRVLAVKGDVSNEEDVNSMKERAMAEFGRIDILIHTAGPWTNTPLKDLDVQKWDAIINGNVKGAYLTSKVVYPVMKQQGWGRIIHISADSSFVRNQTVYGLSKQAVNTLTESLALEMAPKVTVNAIAPGLLEVEEVDSVIREHGKQNTPLNRLATYEDVSQMALFMCSPLFDMVTGKVIVMDGGRTIASYPHFPENYYV
ncbi:SDR family NAD(P)-dependent oxidoreductase [Bacillus alkalicellulosilyticus]|uniref:SDR family NAD(P)-dependent oxidoreductase n=1 Tax=Alkalihalobacterium alkalicellulosilyticum TaxID=1912214 RepID=UPI0009983A33|nr:SDR family oxidoreductase [Bacillus alkalicellulosilyticus]